MYITNAEDLVEVLRPKLPLYLEMKLGKDYIMRPNARMNCFSHNDKNPSMTYHRNGEIAACWSQCGFIDIFKAANIIENLPISGIDFITVTIPYLAEMFKIPIQLAEPTEADKEKLFLQSILTDVAHIMSKPEYVPHEYLKKRGWSNEYLQIASINFQVLLAELNKIGWSTDDILSSRLLRSKNHEYFGDDKVTFMISDYRSRPIGFTTRNPDNISPKYVNSFENILYKKGEALLGLDIALKVGNAKKTGIYIVEGPGDLAALHAKGIFNVAAVCSVAFTAKHLALLKMLNITTVYLCLDWDKAGELATFSILKDELRHSPGVSISIVSSPGTAKDPGEFLETHSGSDFTSLEILPAFSWMLTALSTDATATDICEKLIPIIAAEPTAVKREMLARELSSRINIDITSILSDVSDIIDEKQAERRKKIEGAVQKYTRTVLSDPTNLLTHISQHQTDLEQIEKEYNTAVVGANYQLSRFDLIEQAKLSVDTDNNLLEFKFGKFQNFSAVMEGCKSATSGVLAYFGGEQNSGKTTTVLSLAMDVLINDPNTRVVIQSIDDSLTQIEPSLISMIADLKSKDPYETRLTIAGAANPKINIRTKEQQRKYLESWEILKNFLTTEKLVVIDAEDGATTSALERNLIYLRKRYPTCKLLVIVDNTHRYKDFLNIEQIQRMARISDVQKDITGKYKCAMWATAEYRKRIINQNAPGFAVEDDIADSRSLKYNASIIFDVYNDLNVRKENASIFAYNDIGNQVDRILVRPIKNKITAYKVPSNPPVVLDFNKETLTLSPVSYEIAKAQAAQFQQDKKDGKVSAHHGAVTYIDTDYGEGEYLGE